MFVIQFGFIPCFIYADIEDSADNNERLPGNVFTFNRFDQPVESGKKNFFLRLTYAISDGTGGLSTHIATGDWADATNITTDIGTLDDARDTLRTNSTTLSNQLSTITIRQDFTDKMINTLEDGAANLTNADLNEEGANMLMLQTRQQLGTTSLSMASQAAQAVLRLF